MKKKLLKISIIGKTNSGKSTLINTLVGETISIINKKINTTEELITGILNINNQQLVFYETPGFILTQKNIKKKLIKNLWEGLNQCDLILYILDSKKYNFNEIKTNLIKLKELDKKIIIIFNKIDLVDKNTILPKIKEISNYFSTIDFIDISAKKKIGISYLLKFLLKQAYFSKWIYDDNEITNKDEIFISNEITRNKALTLLNKEIPYNITVKNLIFKYLKNGDLKIIQEIQVTNQRYKKIIIGKNGNKIKDIRIKSQNSISQIMKSKVHLYINIVKSNAEEI